MYEQAASLTIYTETLLHPGSGSAVGAIDLPIQRERHTGFPVIPGSSIKGVIRATAKARRVDDEVVSTVFGPDGQNAADHAGALGFTDARLLLFPVRSAFGVFAWTTCPLVLVEFSRARQAAGLLVPPTVASPLAEHVLVNSPTSTVASDGRVMLEEFTYSATTDPKIGELAAFLAEHIFPQSPDYSAWRDRIPGQLVVLADDDWRDFVTYSTEVITRIRIDQDSGTTDDGALWYEENVPSDALFWSLALATRPRLGRNGTRAEGVPTTASAVLETLDQLRLDRLQIGGDETVGRGLVKVRIERALSGGKAGQP